MQQRGTHAWNSMLAAMLWNRVTWLVYAIGEEITAENAIVGTMKYCMLTQILGKSVKGQKNLNTTRGDCSALTWFYNLRSLSLVYNLTLHTHTVELLTHALFPSRLLAPGKKSNDRVAKTVLYTTFNII